MVVITIITNETDGKEIIEVVDIIVLITTITTTIVDTSIITIATTTITITTTTKTMVVVTADQDPEAQGLVLDLVPILDLVLVRDHIPDHDRDPTLADRDHDLIHRNLIDHVQPPLQSPPNNLALKL